MLVPSAGEAVVGQGVADRYAGAELGDVLAFGRGRWKVVGIFTAGQSSFERGVEWTFASWPTTPTAGAYSGVRVHVLACMASRGAAAPYRRGPRFMRSPPTPSPTTIASRPRPPTRCT
ncbi:MAG: hypothetical protein U0802_05910 [Candidatus Binatia bacterium]